MRKHTIKPIQYLSLLIIAGAIMYCAGSATAAEKSRQGQDILHDTYQRNRSKLEANNFGLPLVVESFELDDRVHVDVYGIFTQPFSTIVNELKLPANWCDIVVLHPNLKACTCSESAGAWLLTFYLGNKEYQHPEDARQVMYRYRNVVQQEGYLDITLRADEGPFGTKDHRMRFEALPLAGRKTFVHVSYTYSDSLALRLATKVYFATIGRDKVGFTVTGTERNGTSVYIGGPRGAVERSAVRYYFAIQSFMNTLHYSEETRFRIRTSEWYDLTTRYKKQLFDLEKKDYVASKIAEHKHQVMLQQRIGAGFSSEYFYK